MDRGLGKEVLGYGKKQHPDQNGYRAVSEGSVLENVPVSHEMEGGFGLLGDKRFHFRNV